jgi:endonuclease/exonuclease/phosphatase family metal-dependent hydrolase
MMVFVLIGLGGYLGCDPNSIPAPELGEQAALTSTSSSSNSPTSIPQRSASTVLIGSFNLERLGPSKLSDPWVMEKFADIIRLFDVIALQEITSKDQRTLPTLIEQINRSGGRYSYTISPRVGREASGYYEQYAYVFDTSRIRGGPEFCYLVQDQADILHREPFVGRFEAIGANQPFSFTLINIHTDPDEIKYELDVLADVFVNVRQFEYPEDDVMLLGDLNASPAQFQKLGTIPGLVPLIQGIPTNSRQNKTLDNILTDLQMSREYTGRSGAIDVERMFRLQLADAERISDHLPIWAEFTISEQVGGFSSMAGATPTVVR